MTAVADTLDRPEVATAGRGFFQAIVGWLFGEKELSEVQRHFIAESAARVGDPILASADLDDFACRLEEVMEGPDFRDWLRMLRGLVTKKDIHALATECSEPSRDLVEKFGCEWLLADGFRLVHAIAIAALSLESLEDFLTSKDEIASNEDPLAFLADPEVPVPIARVLLTSFQGTACFPAILRATTVGRPPAWLARAIAETWVRGLRADLRLLASIPGAEVSEELVPREERIDLQRAARTAKMADLAFRELVDRARETNAPIYPESERGSGN